jgi:IclR family transcriptional regulator, KDG regulon repressor
MALREPRPDQRTAHHADRYRVQVLDRALGILEVLAAADECLGPTELAARLSLHKSTTHRLLAVLERHQFIRRNPVDRTYGLGVRLFQLGARPSARMKLRETAEPILRQLALETGETAHVCVLEGDELMTIATVEGRWSLRTPSTIGRRISIHSTAVGKALLAFLPEQTSADLLSRMTLPQLTPHTIVSRAVLCAELRRIQKCGFAIDDEEKEIGLRCVGAPIFDRTGAVVASMSVAGPVFRIKKERLPEFSRTVVAAGLSLSRNLGYEKSTAPLTPVPLEPRNRLAKPGPGSHSAPGVPAPPAPAPASTTTAPLAMHTARRWRRSPRPGAA